MARTRPPPVTAAASPAAAARRQPPRPLAGRFGIATTSRGGRSCAFACGCCRRLGIRPTSPSRANPPVSAGQRLSALPWAAIGVIVLPAGDVECIGPAILREEEHGSHGLPRHAASDPVTIIRLLVAGAALAWAGCASNRESDPQLSRSSHEAGEALLRVGRATQPGRAAPRRVRPWPFRMKRRPAAPDRVDRAHFMVTDTIPSGPPPADAASEARA